MEGVPPPPAARYALDDERPLAQLERSRLVQWFKRASAVVRWVILVVVVGLGAAAVVAVAFAALVTLIDNSL